MFEKMKNSAVLKMIILKLLVYVLLITSFIMFGKGWLTFESSRMRRDVTKEVTDLLSQSEDISQSDWDTLNDYLADYDLDISAEELVEKEIDVFNALKDAEISPKEAVTIITCASWLGEKANRYLGIEVNQEYQKAISKLKIYSIILQALYYITILMFWAAIVALVTCHGIGTYFYSIMAVIQFVFFAVLRTRTNTFMERGLSAVGISVTGGNLAMRFCTPAFIALICAIVSSIFWTILLVISKRERARIPGVKILLEKIAKGGEDRKILPKGQVCLCGAKLDKNDKFCPVCGRKVIEKAPNTCIKCGAALEPDSMFCAECGTKVEPIQDEPVSKVNTCRFCGKELERGALFCSGCGKRQTDEDDKTVISDMILKNKLITLINSEDRAWQVKGILKDGLALNIGRSNDMDLKVDINNSVSREHCRVFMKDGKIYAEDLDSSYKTYVDGQLADTPLLLRDGSILTLGTCKLEVKIDDMKE